MLYTTTAASISSSTYDIAPAATKGVETAQTDYIAPGIAIELAAKERIDVLRSACTYVRTDVRTQGINDGLIGARSSNLAS